MTKIVVDDENGEVAIGFLDWIVKYLFFVIEENRGSALCHCLQAVFQPDAFDFTASLLLLLGRAFSLLACWGCCR